MRSAPPSDPAEELAGHSGLRIIIGGILRTSRELVGPAAEAMLSDYHLDIAFIGVDGLTPDKGCTTYDEMEAQTDLAFLRRARRSIVIAAASKLGKVTFARISPLSEVGDVGTDVGAQPQQFAGIEAARPSVVAVQRSGRAPEPFTRTGLSPLRFRAAPTGLGNASISLCDYRGQNGSEGQK